VASLLREWRTRLAPIYPGEGKVVGLCLAVNFFVIAGIMFGRNARDSLFLIYFGVEYLPIMYFANAAFLILCSVGYTMLVDRIERGKFLAGVSVIFILALLASRVVLLDHPRWFFPVLYIEAQVVWYFTLMQFWTFAGDLFDTRQAKRLFPFLAVGALLGMIGVGLGSRRVVHGLGTENLLVVWAGLNLVALVLGSIAYRRYRLTEVPAKIDAACPKRPKLSELQKIKAGFNEVGRQPLLRSMAVYVLLMWTVYAIVDFCFSKTIRARYPNPTDLTTFLGFFVGVQGFLCLLIQLFFVRSVIARLGVGTTINFHPAILIAGTTWTSLGYGFGSVFSTKLGDASMLYTFSDSSYQLLYNPVPLDRRARVRGFIEGYIRPLSLAAGGGLILLGNSYLKPLHFLGREIAVGQQLAWGALILAGVWFVMALTVKKGYIRALLENLQSDSPALRQAAAKALGRLKDASSLEILTSSLHSESPQRVIAAIRFLEDFESEESGEMLAGLLSHPDSRVRATAVSALGRRGGAEYIGRLTPLLGDVDARVRANTIEALASAGDPALVDKLRPLLEDSSMRARINTVLTIAAIKGVSAALELLPRIKQLTEGDPQARATATYALGRLPLDQSMDLLAVLLRDPELRIRCEAARALGHIGTPRVIPPLVEALAGPSELRRQVRRSLAAIARRHGEETLRELESAASNTPRAELRSELADVLGRLKSPRVTDTLLQLLKDPEWRVRWKVLKSFERLSRDGPLAENVRTELFAYARYELEAYGESLLCTEAVVPQPSTEAERVLAAALVEDRANIVERVFHMLGIVCGRDRMIPILKKLRSPNPRLRADALEALDTLAPKPIARQVLRLLEPAPAVGKTARPTVEPSLRTLANHPKPWVRACTANYLGKNLPVNADTLLEQLVQDRDPLVRETALYAGWQAFKDAWSSEVTAASHSPDPALRRAAQKILMAQPGATAGAVTPAGRSKVMLLTLEKALFLKSAPIFAEVEGEELAALADIALEHEFQTNEIIFEENQAPHHLYLIVQGKVEVFRRVNEHERALAHLGERECFGEMAILDDQPRSASVRATEPTTVLKIDRDSFHELIVERPQIAFAIFTILSGRLRHQNLEADNLPAVYSGGQYA
jgi:HEAT repeat protein